MSDPYDWRAGYDSWKLREPEPYGDEPDLEDDHDCNEDVDVGLDGVRTCCRCGRVWMPTQSEINSEVNVYMANARAEQEQWWHDKLLPARQFLYRTLDRLGLKRTSVSAMVMFDDEIPF